MGLVVEAWGSERVVSDGECRTVYKNRIFLGGRFESLVEFSASWEYGRIRSDLLHREGVSVWRSLESNALRVHRPCWAKGLTVPR